ncbi:MAG: ABC transporter permease [Gammaproteobacteria bacterium]|nr:ABC transporter permease [Gammaproteobacteria bacterium]
MNFARLRSLFSKEIHHLIPLLIALAVLEVLGLLDSFWAQSPETLTWSDLSIFLDRDLATVAGGLYFLIGMVAAYMMFSHEGKQQTLLFLWSLPVKRWHIFFVKLTTAMATMAAMILLGQLTSLWVNSFSVGSLTIGQFSWPLWWREVGALTGVTAIALGYGALVASFRLVGILGFVVAWAAAMVLAYLDASFQYLNVMSLLDLEFRGSEILLNAKTWTVHSAIAAICTLLALYRWTRDSRERAQPTRASRVGTRIGTGLSALVVILFIVAYGTTQIAPQLLYDDGDVQEPSLQSIETQHYEFAFFDTDVGAAAVLLAEADQYTEQVMQLLGYETSERILADLTDNSSTDHLGIAGWKKLRMKRSALYDDDLRTHVFVHESAHVLAAAASDRRLSDHYASSLFFIEGLAEWVSFELLELTDERHSLRLLSALAWQRLNLRFDDMLYSDAFLSRFDQGLIYALGEAWVSTLAEVCGQDAPGAALKAMARPDAPQRVQGVTFWRDNLQAIGCDLSEVNSRFTLLMRSYEGQIAEIPELTGAVSTLDGHVVVSLTLGASELEEAYRVLVRVRDSANASSQSVISESAELIAGETVAVKLPLRMISGQRFQYQIGLEFLPGERPFFSRWIDEG